MATSYQSFIDQAVTMYTRAADPNTVSSDISMIAQVLTPNIFQDLAVKYAGDEQQRHLLKQTFVLNCANGIAVTDPSVLTSSMNHSLLYDPADLTAVYSFQRNYTTLVTATPDPRIGMYGIEFAGQLRIVAAGTPFSLTTGPTQSFGFNVAVIPQVPVLATDPVLASDEFLSDAIESLSEALRGAVLPG